MVQVNWIVYCFLAANTNGYNSTHLSTVRIQLLFILLKFKLFQVIFNISSYLPYFNVKQNLKVIA